MELIEILKVVILGIIQGITEWLPISSTGHMILADTFLQLQQPKDFMDMFYVVIQLGSILAVVVLYFNKLNPFSRAKSRAERLSTFQLWFKVIVAIVADWCYRFAGRRLGYRTLLHSNRNCDCPDFLWRTRSSSCWKNAIIV